MNAARTLSPRALIAILRAKRKLAAIRNFSLVGLAAIVVFLVLSSVSGGKRSFVLDLQTTVLNLKFEGNITQWAFDSAILCRRLDQPNLSVAQGQGPCSAIFYDIEPTDALLLNWREGVEIEVRTSGPDRIVIEILEGVQPGAPEGSLIVIPAETWIRAGALTFLAQLEAGSRIGTGQQTYLLGGRWEARQEAAVLSLFRDMPETVRSGQAVLGTTLSVYEDNQPVPVFGYLTPDLSSGLVHFNLVAHSAPGNTELRVRVFGADGPTIVRTDWIDIALSSPLLLALAVLFSILASLTQVFTDVRTTIAGARSEHDIWPEREVTAPAAKPEKGPD